MLANKPHTGDITIGVHIQYARAACTNSRTLTSLVGIGIAVVQAPFAELFICDRRGNLICIDSSLVCSCWPMSAAVFAPVTMQASANLVWRLRSPFCRHAPRANHASLQMHPAAVDQQVATRHSHDGTRGSAHEQMSSRARSFARRSRSTVRSSALRGRHKRARAA